MKVSIACSKQKIELSLSPQSSVLTLKHTLSALTHIPVALQLLETYGTELRDNSPISDYRYKRKRGITQKLDQSSQFPLKYRFRPLVGEPVAVSVFISDSVLAVAGKVATALGVCRDEVRIAVNGKELELTLLVADFYKPGVFVLEVLRPEECYVWVKLGDGSFKSVAAAPGQTVGDFLSRLSKSHWISTVSRCLLYSGSELPFDATFSSLGITPGQSLSLSPLPATTIFAQSLAHSFMEISSMGLTSVQDLIQEVEKRVESTSSLQLLYRGKVLVAADTLESTEIVPGAIVEYGEIVLHARTSNIEVVRLGVCSDVPVSAVVAELSSRLLLPAITLVHKGEILSESKSLSAYSLASDTALKVLLPTDSYVWVKCAYEKASVDIPDFSARIIDVILNFTKLTGSTQDFDCALYHGQIIDIQQPLNHYGIYPGAVISLYCHHVEAIIFVAGVEKSSYFGLLKTQNVATLKEKISKKWGISPKKLHIFCKGIELEPDECIEYLADTCLQVVKKGEKLISLTNVEDNQVYYLPCTPAQSVLSLKHILADKLSTPIEDLVFVWKKQILDNSADVSELGESILLCILICKTDMHFFQLKYNSVCHIMRVPSFSIPISQVKLMCTELIPEPFSLYWKWTKLEDDKTLSDSSVSLGAKLTATTANDVIITVGELRGFKQHFILNRRDAVYDLMRVIQHKMGHSAKHQILIAEKERITNTQASVSSIPSEILVLQMNEKYAYITFLSKLKEIVFFEKTDTVKTFVQKVAEITNLKVGEFVLVYENRRLWEQSSVNCSQIRMGGEIQLFTASDPVLIITFPSNTLIKRINNLQAPLGLTFPQLKQHSDTTFYHNSSPLDCTFSADHYGLTACSEIYGLTPKQKILEVNTHSRGVIRVIVNCGEWRIGAVKTAISAKTGDPSHTIKLYCKGRLCKNDEIMVIERDFLALLEEEMLFIAETLYGERVLLVMKIEATVGNLREAIATRLHRSANSLRLKANNSLLVSDSQALGSIELPSSNVLEVLYPEDILLTVCSPDKKEKFAYKCSDTIKKLRTLLHQQYCPNWITLLLYNGRVLADHYTFAEYRMQREAVVCHLTANYTQVTVANYSGGGFSKVFPWSELSYSKIGTFVREKIGVEIDSLSCVVPLRSTEVISQYHLPELVRVDLVHSDPICARNSFYLCVKHFADKEFLLKVESEIAIGNLAKKVEARIQSQNIRLIIAGTVAENSLTLADYGVKDQTTVTLILESDCIARVHPADQDPFLVAISPETTANMIKSRITESTGIPKEEQKLFVADDELNPTDRLCKFGCDVDVVVQAAQAMVIVESVNSEKVAICCSLTSSVQSLKERVGSALGVISTHQRLIYRDIVMENENTLQSYGVKSGSKIVLLRPAEVQFAVNSPLGTEFFVYAKENAAVEDIRIKIAKRCNVFKGDVQLLVHFPNVTEKTFQAISKDVYSLHFTFSPST